MSYVVMKAARDEAAGGITVCAVLIVACVLYYCRFARDCSTLETRIYFCFFPSHSIILLDYPFL